MYHTFTGDNEGTVCPPVSGTVGTDDDGCADIPPHKRTNSICPADSPTGNSCTGGPNDYIHNFMDYSSDACFTGFSNDQRNRVIAAVNGPRAAFIKSIAHLSATNTYPAAVTNTPTFSSQTDGGYGIYEVTLNGNTYKSLSAYNDGFYLNRVASQPATTLLANTAYTMTVKVGVGSTSNNELVDVYIDYNNDGSFSTAERIYQTAAGSGKNNGGVFSFNFTTPTVGNFTNSQKLRMRVISGFDDGVNALASSFSTSNSNIEDYSVVFNPTLKVATNLIEDSAISIYPNPAKDFLNITNTSIFELKAVSIIDTLGKIIYTGTNTDKINVSNLENGMYLVKIELSNSTTVTKHFIKK